MPNRKRTSKAIAAKVSKLLSNSKSTKAAKSVAASGLSQTRKK